MCKACVERLRQWTSGIRQSMGSGIPMVWKRYYKVMLTAVTSVCDRGK